MRASDPERLTKLVAARLRSRIADYYRKNPGCSRTECAAALGISRKTVQRHLIRLRQEIDASQSERRDAA